MPLEDLFIASEEVARTGASNLSAPGRSPSPEAVRIGVKGFGLIPLTKLLCLLFEEEWKVSLLREFPIVHEETEDGPWVRSLPNRLVEKVRGLTKDQIAEKALAWAKSDEVIDLEGRMPGVTKEVLTNFVNLTNSN